MSGFRLYTLDHDLGTLRLDLEAAWADMAPPRLQLPPHLLQQDPPVCPCLHVCSQQGFPWQCSEMPARAALPLGKVMGLCLPTPFVHLVCLRSRAYGGIQEDVLRALCAGPTKSQVIGESCKSHMITL